MWLNLLIHAIDESFVYQVFDSLMNEYIFGNMAFLQIWEIDYKIVVPLRSVSRDATKGDN